MDKTIMHWKITSLGLLYAIFCVFGVDSAQHFITKPGDTAVIEGQEALLKCVIGDRAGGVQWTKDGFAMGFERDIPGYPRYRMSGSETLGEYDLYISKTTLEDDAKFECQVGLRPDNPNLAASANLYVFIKPEMPEIQGYPNASLVEIPHEQETVNMTCISRKGKPPATLKWFRNGEEITENIQYVAEDAGSKLLDAKSIITLTPKEEDNGALFTCTAANNASIGLTMETTVALSVMHPPSSPVITGYKTGTVVKTGNSLILLCKTIGGNPAPQVHWYKNNKELDFSYQTGDGEAINEYSFTIQPNDNEAVYRCEVKNRVTPEPLTADVKLTVQFGPAKVIMSGNMHAKAGETIILTCTTEISNPPAKISWYGRGQAISADSHVVTASPLGGFVTASNISVKLTDLSNEMLYSCHAFNDALGKTVTATRSLSVMYPPGDPVISGYNEGREIEEGNVLTMTCQSHGGNPLATLTWWKGEEEIEGETRITDKIVTNRISFILKAEDNQVKYRCNATNPATPEPLLTDVKLTINYPPRKVMLSTEPEQPKAGQPLKIRCKSGSSNPESHLSWWKDGMRLPQGQHVETIEADWGGKSTVNELSLVPTVEDNGEIYECRATNVLLEKAMVDAIALDVSFQPSFSADSPSVFSLLEGTAGILNLTASGNPQPITYTWYKDGDKITFGESKTKRDVSIPHFVPDGGVLNITNVTRKDAGTYTVEASNTEGATKYDVKLDVQYPAGITKITDKLTVDQNSIAKLVCEVDANPMPERIISWARKGYNMSRVTITNALPGKSELMVKNVNKDDSGTFTCSATNGVKDTATGEAKLVVKYAPEIDRSQRYSKAAARSMETGVLLCKAEGAPAVEFTWYKGTSVLDTSGVRYHKETTQDGIVHYTSQLQMFNVTQEDYGFYRCQAKNNLGTDSHNIHLDDTSEPEPPYDISYINTTHNSVALAWEPGFNGGAPQTFRIQYRRVGSEGYKTEEVTPRNATLYIVAGLARATDYEFSVQGENDFGASPFQPKFITVRTAAVAANYQSQDDVPLIFILTVSIFGMILLALNILLILFFYRRRKKKMEKDASESASAANTVEMFSAPTVTEDSKSYTTFEHRSLDEYPEDFRIYDPDDELKRFLPPPHYSSTDIYRPPSSHIYGPPPHLGHAPHLGSAPHLPGIYGTMPRRAPSPTMDQMRPSYPGVPHPWDSRTYGPYGGTLPRAPPSHPPQDDTPEEYANQIRALTKSISQPDDRIPRDQGPQSLPMRPPPPVPPTRSSSKPHLPPGDGPSSMPPLPSRNYDRDDVPPSGRNEMPSTPRYVPPPAFQSGSRPNSRPASRPSSRPPSRPTSRPSSRPPSHYDLYHENEDEEDLVINYHNPGLPPYKAPPPPPPPKPRVRGEFV